MAIDVIIDQAAEGVGCFERPSYIGNTASTVRQDCDFDDCFLGVILNARPDGYQVVSGDYFQFQIQPISSVSATNRFGVDLKFLGGPWLSDGPTLDLNGEDPVIGDRPPLNWYQAQVSLEPFVGMTLDQVVAWSEEDDAGAYAFKIRGGFITNGGTVQKRLFDGLVTGYPTTSQGIYMSSVPFSYSVDLLLDPNVINYGIPRIVSSGSSNSITASDLVVIDTSTSNMTFNLPDAASLPSGKVYFFKNRAASATLTIDPFSTQTIDGSTTLVLSAGQQAEIVRLSSAAWVRIGS